MPSEFKVGWDPTYFYLSELEECEANRALWIFGSETSALDVVEKVQAAGRLSEINWHSRIQSDNRIRWVSLEFGATT